ncbi:MAG: hypothetical protein H6Q68_2506 [Firmicutes bacterium]|nr:hypothetical protein [Bacillota bacterium]
MGIFTEIRNEALVRELERELNTDVLLFGFDGFIYFGNIQGIEDCRIALLSPAIKAETRDVQILSPGGELVRVDFLRVDLWQIVAKGTAIVDDPIAYSNGPGSAPVIPQRTVTEERQESHHLIRQLCRMIGDNVVITTLGGFLFEGTLGDIDDELAILKVDDIFGPATSSSISGSDVRSVIVNLEALTSVSSSTCC